jgi:hypothetical protein
MLITKGKLYLNCNYFSYLSHVNYVKVLNYSETFTTLTTQHV